jgi:hypothetical protein
VVSFSALAHSYWSPRALISASPPSLPGGGRPSTNKGAATTADGSGYMALVVPAGRMEIDIPVEALLTHHMSGMAVCLNPLASSVGSRLRQISMT